MREQRKYWREDLIGHLEDAKILALSIQDAIGDEEIEKHEPVGFNRDYDVIAAELTKMLRKLRSLP
jgi:hypothetical protein